MPTTSQPSKSFLSVAFSDWRFYAAFLAVVGLWFLHWLIFRGGHKQLSLPLLRKELTELAARKRTYVIRILYAVLLLSISAASMAQVAFSTASTNPFAILGTGGQMYESLLWFQVIGVMLLTPAMACGTITSEKEKNTLGLLFLTRLGPWGILFEKLLSRLIPVLSFLLLSMPLFAIAYSFGGVQWKFLVVSLGALFALAIQMAALSLMCSTYFRTTAAAFIWAYVLESTLLFFVSGSMVAQMRFGGPITSVKLLIQATLVSLVITAITLGMARFFLFRRAFVKPKQLILKAFKYMDQLFTDLNDRYTKGIVLVKENVNLPEDDPIAWRETTKRTLGTVRYLFRVFVAIELPLVFFCLLLTVEVSMGRGYALSYALFFVWILTALILTVQAAGLIASERTHETLNVLLTTNLTSREIISQKYAGVRRAINVLRVPLVTVFLFQMFIFGGFRGVAIGGFHPVPYSVCFLLAVIIYPQMIGWLSVFISLFVKGQSRAILTSLMVQIVWCFSPLLLLILMSFYSPTPRVAAGYRTSPALLASPATIIALNESRERVWIDNSFERYANGESLPFESARLFGLGPEATARLQMTVFNFLIYAAITFALRLLCFRMVATRLGRNDGKGYRLTDTTEPPSKIQLAAAESKG